MQLLIRFFSYSFVLRPSSLGERDLLTPVLIGWSPQASTFIVAAGSKPRPRIPKGAQVARLGEVGGNSFLARRQLHG